MSEHKIVGGHAEMGSFVWNVPEPLQEMLFGYSKDGVRTRTVEAFSETERKKLVTMVTSLVTAELGSIAMTMTVGLMKAGPDFVKETVQVMTEMALARMEKVVG